MHRLVILPWCMIMLTLFTASSAKADSGYRFFYNLILGTSFVEQEQIRQENGGKVISHFDRTIQYQVSQISGSHELVLTAKTICLRNNGRRIDYYDGATFRANILAKGVISGCTLSGG